MNSSSNATTTSTMITEYYTMDSFLTNHGSTWLLDNLQFYPFIVIGPLGFFLNMLAFSVYRDKHEFKDVPLHVYMRIYCLNSALLSLVSTFNFCYSYRVFYWANTYWAQVWVNYFFKPISKGCYFYGGLLDIAILLDRIAFFNKCVKSCMSKLRPCVMCVIALAFAIVVDCSYYFIWKPTSKTVMLSSHENFTLWFTSNTEFAADTLFGTLLTFALFILTDLVVMVANLILNMISAYYMRKHLGNKLKISLKLKVTPFLIVTPLVRLIQRGEATVASRRGPESQTELTNQTSDSHQFVVARTSRIESNATSTSVVNFTNSQALQLVSISSSAGGSNTRRGRQGRAKSTKSQADQIASKNLKATVMVTFMCILSIVEHLIMITCNYYIFYSTLNFSTFALSAVGNFVMPFKRCFNFLIFYSFNVNFKRVCHRVLGLSTP